MYILNKQARTTYVVSNPEDITVRIDASMPTTGVDNWRPEIQQAINDWNSITTSRLHLRLVTGTAEITIRSDGGALGDRVIADASFPTSNGNPGNRIE